MFNRDPPELLGDADLLTRLLAAAKVRHPRATANALLAKFGSFAETLGGATGMQEETIAYLATVRAAALRMLTAKSRTAPRSHHGPPWLITCASQWRLNRASNSVCCSWTGATT